ncbi:MAG: helix-turn-helix domain-containing protein, partial [Flavitalea sp.]
DYNAALEKLNRCLFENPRSIPAHTVKCYCLLKLGFYDQVISHFETLDPEILVPAEKFGLTALAYALKKDKERTEENLQQLVANAATTEGFRTSSFLFLMYAALGENDKAFAWVDQAIATKSPLLLIHFVDPLVDALKKDVRYEQYYKLIFPGRDEGEMKKTRKDLLGANAKKTYAARLLDYITTKKPYLDPGLSLRSLAGQVKMHPNELSWLLNESMGKCFTEFVNHYRVKDFKLRSRDPKNADKAIMDLAYDCGFSSKTAFATYFKKETGQTLKQYYKEIEVSI